MQGEGSVQRLRWGAEENMAHLHSSISFPEGWTIGRKKVQRRGWRRQGLGWGGSFSAIWRRSIIGEGL